MTQNLSENKEKEYIQKIKELQYKLQIVSKAFKEKTAQLEASNTNMKNQLTELESVINTKEKEIIRLTTESNEIQNALSLERNKSDKTDYSVSNLIGNIFQKEGNDPLKEIEIKKLQNSNDELKSDKQKLLLSLEELQISSKKTIEEKENKIKELQRKLEEKENIIQEKIKELSENSKRLNVMAGELKDFDSVKKTLNSTIISISEEYEKLKEEKSNLENQLKAQRDLVNEWQIKIKKYKQENLQLAMEAMKYKFAFAESSAVIQKFKCEKIGRQIVKCEITFGQTEDNEYVMLIQEEKSKEERYNIENVEYVKMLNEKVKTKMAILNKVEISILVR